MHRVRRSVISDNANYNRTEEQTPQGFHYKIGVVSDLDKKSKVRNTETKSDEWISYFITANLYVQYNPENLKEANVSPCSPFAIQEKRIISIIEGIFSR